MSSVLSSGRRALLTACLAGVRCRRLQHYRPDHQRRNNLFLVFPAICAGLGAWQVYRRRWKLDLIDSLERRMSSQPLVVNEPLAPMLGRLSELEFTPVTLRGEFDHSREILIGPRHYVDPADPADERERGGGGIVGGGNRHKVGFHVVTPFRVSATGEWILANRGWVPQHSTLPEARQRGQVTGEVTISGLVRQTEKNKWLRQGGEPKLRWGSRDIGAISEQLDTLPFFIDCLASCDVDGGPRGGQTRASVRNEHLTYIITWWSLGTLMLCFWLFRIR